MQFLFVAAFVTVLLLLPQCLQRSSLAPQVCPFSRPLEYLPLCWESLIFCIGILGREIVRALGKDPQQWQTVHALSRIQKEKYPTKVKHDFIDLTASAKEMAQQLEGVEAEYVFFAAYLQKDSEQANWDVNGTIAQVVQ